MKYYLFGTKFKDKEFENQDTGYLINEINSQDEITENQFEDMILKNFQNELFKYSLIVLFDENYNLLFRTFLMPTGEKEDEKTVLTPFTGIPSIQEKKQIYLAICFWNDAIENLKENDFDYPKINVSKLEEEIKNSKRA